MRGAERIIESKQKFRAESGLQGGSWLGREMRNPLDPHVVKALHCFLRYAERRHRQSTQRISDPAWSNNTLAPKTRDCPGTAGCVRDRDFSIDPGCCKAGRDVLKQRRFALKEMRGPCNIDKDAVWRVWRHQRRVARAPETELFQRGPVLLWCGLHDVQIGHQRLRMRERHAGMKLDPSRRFVRSHDNASIAFLHDRDHRTVTRWRAGVLPPHAVAARSGKNEKRTPLAARVNRKRLAFE